MRQKKAKKQKYPHLVGSKWTAKQKTWGWRHFQVVNRKTEGKWVFAEMVASCDQEVRFWLNAKQLKDESLWEAGWKTLSEMQKSPLKQEPNLIIIEH
ncbi:MAG: TIGR02450 family Trp-rich protein [Cyanobacteria bacterium J083]|nr:MAG: TIGR02450 family Trp-rich protein [Cyanobacteria bacterium J083]